MGCSGKNLENLSIKVFTDSGRPYVVIQKNIRTQEFILKVCVYINSEKICPEFNPSISNFEFPSETTLSYDYAFFSLTLQVNQTHQGIILTPKIVNKNDQTIKLQGIILKLSPNLPKEVNFAYHEGYQSWSPSFGWNPEEVEEDVPESDYFEIAYDDTVFLNQPYQSWWLSAYETEDYAIVGGALNAEIFKTKVFTTKKGLLKIVNGCSIGDEKSIEPDKSLSLDILTVIVGNNIFEALENYGITLGERIDTPKTPFIPAGWNSWNVFFDNINSEQILAQINLINSIEGGENLKVIQIDDGWEKAWGLWDGKEEFVEPFTNMKEVADEIKKQGKIPGIWIAPFLYDSSLTGAVQHPEWFLKDEKGDYIKYQNRFLVIDITNSEAENFVRSTIAKLKNWGFKYLKLDFLFAEAMKGKRYNESTSIEAYRKAIRVLKEEAGDDVYLLACGAPVLPSTGYFHGIRFGPDIAVKYFRYSWAFVKNEFRNVFWRFYWNYIFAGDPDTVLLRNLSLQESKLFLTASILSGKIFALGDDIKNLEEDKMILIEKLLTSMPFSMLIDQDSVYPVPHSSGFDKKGKGITDIFSTYITPWKYYEPEVVWAKGGEYRILGIFNWGEGVKEINIDLETAGICSKSCSGREFWSGKFNNTGKLKTKLNPHSAQLWIMEE